MSLKIAESLAEAMRLAGFRDGEFTITPVVLSRAQDGYVFDTVRRGRAGRITVGADVTADGFTTQTEDAADAYIRDTFKIAARSESVD